MYTDYGEKKLDENARLELAFECFKEDDNMALWPFEMVYLYAKISLNAFQELFLFTQKA